MRAIKHWYRRVFMSSSAVPEVYVGRHRYEDRWAR